MGETNNILNDIQEIEKLTRQFETSMRTSFHTSGTNYITIQRVNSECEQLKRKVRDILNIQMLPSNLRFKVIQVSESALFLISKFEEALNKGIEFDGDLLMKIGNQQNKKR